MKSTGFTVMATRCSSSERVASFVFPAQRQFDGVANLTGWLAKNDRGLYTFSTDTTFSTRRAAVVQSVFNAATLKGFHRVNR